MDKGGGTRISLTPRPVAEDELNFWYGGNDKAEAIQMTKNHCSKNRPTQRLIT
jgi:hypothetical protein